MRFSKHRHESLPEVNLVPMMDVLMTVLTFFIIISMTLSGQVVNVFLPKSDTESAKEGSQGPPEPLVVGLNAEKQVLLDNKPATMDQMIQNMTTYFQKYPNGTVTLKADRSLTYRDVSELLKAMRDVGGGRVYLAIDQ